MAPERIDFSRLAAQPWKNGGGTTREIAIGFDDRVAEQRGTAALADFDWRISIADIDRDGPFSAFPGIDRCIVLLEGAGMHLQSVDGGTPGDAGSPAIDQRLAQCLDQHGEPFHFPGDLPLAATLIDGPSRDLNVMLRRGRFRCDVHCATQPGRLPPADIRLLWALSGQWTLEDATAARHPLPSLGPAQGLLWRQPAGPATFAPAPGSDRPALLCVIIERTNPTGTRAP